MEIPEPKYNLNINSMSHGAMTGQMLAGIENVLLDEKPDYVLVYGDTNSTIAGALAARKLHIAVIHVEAGLRSYNMLMPEEINRILTDRISNLLFCPTEKAVMNLKEEGFNHFDCSIFLSGDVMQDSALFYGEKASKQSSIIKDLAIEGMTYLLCTIHRAENTDDENNLNQIIHALNTLSKDYRIVLPLHPRTKKIVVQRGIKLNFTPIDPVGYLDMINLIQHSRLILTDSGGLQKEAYFFDKYCITLREQTEWTELVDNHVNFLTGADSEKIIESERKISGKLFPEKINLYGNGMASRSICNAILDTYSNH
jgi:UDP-GlcNAc3NAcA epimerase